MFLKTKIKSPPKVVRKMLNPLTGRWVTVKESKPKKRKTVSAAPSQPDTVIAASSQQPIPTTSSINVEPMAVVFAASSQQPIPTTSSIDVEPMAAGFYHENLTIDCDASKYYVSEALQKRSCTVDLDMFSRLKCSTAPGLQPGLRFFTDIGRKEQIICFYMNVKNTDCENEAPKQHGTLQCTVNGKIKTFTCYFNVSEEYLGKQIDCRAFCKVNISDIEHNWIVTNSTCPLYTGVPTLEPPTTAAPTTTAAPPEKEFPIWAAVVIALGIAGLIALLLFLVWRKRRQAQGLAQDAEGRNTGNPEGEEAEGGEDNAEEEEATNAESAEKSEDAEGGEEAPEEE